MKVETQKAREKRKENEMREKIRYNKIKRGGRNEDKRKAEEPSCWLALKKRMKSKEGC